MGWSCSQNRKKGSALKMLSGKPGGKIPLGRRKRRWEGNIRVHLSIRGIGLIRLRIRITGEPL